jgi:cellobiose-specific phosphotransferase system component IIC
MRLALKILIYTFEAIFIIYNVFGIIAEYHKYYNNNRYYHDVLSLMVFLILMPFYYTIKIRYHENLRIQLLTNTVYSIIICSLRTDEFFQHLVYNLAFYTILIFVLVLIQFTIYKTFDLAKW